MENYAGVIGAPDEYSIFLMLSILFKLEQSCCFHSCWSMRGKMLHVYLFIYFLTIKITSSFSAINLCFVINVLNNKTIILLNLVEYRLI